MKKSGFFACVGLTSRLTADYNEIVHFGTFESKIGKECFNPNLLNL